LSGNIRKLGRVDNGDAFLDTEEIEKQRGITIFSKQARLTMGELDVTLLDTPGHVDFSAEMERTIQVMDYAILVVSGTQGVQSHTRTLWNLLKRYEIPTFIFVNKMDRPEADKDAVLAELHRELSSDIIDFQGDFHENAALCHEEALEAYMEQGYLDVEMIQTMVADRLVFPCYFGSALKTTGVDRLMEGIEKYTATLNWKDEFSARVYKIARDVSGTRLTYLKITGGCLHTRDTLITGEDISEKVNQIRLYSGTKYITVNEAPAGMVCAVTGLDNTYAGQNLGAKETEFEPVLEPVLSYELVLPKDCDALETFNKLGQIKEENPELNISWNNVNRSISVNLMGEVQTEVLKTIVKERFGIEVGFGAGHILYKETITQTAEGVGHYEPLRHYAEVHILLEPLERGAGIVIDTDCSEDVLDKNWQRLILTHLEEKIHRGVLTGSPVTDIKMTLVTGRAHQKHTEGGDFRQATYRAVRNGLMYAGPLLLEPYYRLVLELPSECLGRAMNDIQQRFGHFKPATITGDRAVLEGIAPVACVYDYAKEVAAYTGGRGSLSYTFNGYGKCHNEQEIIEKMSYDPVADTRNPVSSVFCAHGSGFVVEWDEVKDYMHMEYVYGSKNNDNSNIHLQASKPKSVVSDTISQEEIEAIFASTFYANRRDKAASPRKFKYSGKRTVVAASHNTGSSSGKKYSDNERYLLVDGYNCIFAWEELNELSKINIDGARTRLLDIMCNYQGIEKIRVIVVFDAYRVVGHDTEIFDYHNIHVVYTKEAETADQYIEKFAHENGRKYDVTVATSDGLEQIIIRGQGCKLLSARELEKLTKDKTRESLEKFAGSNVIPKNTPFKEILGKNAQN
ncbi:MAG: NYN domain-containing protein, partial [Lachnospiraceae bacterium]